MPKINNAAIVGYGVYIPRYRIKAEELARVWGKSSSDLPVKEKAVAGLDEDTVTMSAEAARYALMRAGVDPSKVSAVHVGTESKPYAVKPSGTLVAEILGLSRHITSADLEFACKAGTEAIQMVTALVETGRIDYGLAIGADTAQGRPGDALEFTAASGAAAFLIGRADTGCIARFEYATSVVTDTPDFWRRSYERYPTHASRFTGEPAYFYHTLTAINTILNENGYSTDDIDYFVFHQPNVKFPLTVAKLLSIPYSKVSPGLVSDVVGNTYAACSMLGLAKVLDTASPGQRILMTSYGSGAGSDSFLLTVCDGIVEKRDKAPSFQQLLNRNKQIDYAIYLKYRDKIRV
ncbi:MAG: hydroxymethylglutaryl-CoA synthase [Candidatus Caldarchaeum sp.]|uniref:Hydroxymethylglutaryl-CoA synthase n=1 Tax=Caldiarchaeum subterraneum TaxID=311458 RepID=A0A7C5QQS9_CALS0